MPFYNGEKVKSASKGNIMGLKEVLVSVKKGATRDGIEKNIPFLEKKFQPAFYTEKNLFQTL